MKEQIRIYTTTEGKSYVTDKDNAELNKNTLKPTGASILCYTSDAPIPSPTADLLTPPVKICRLAKVDVGDFDDETEEIAERATAYTPEDILCTTITTTASYGRLLEADADTLDGDLPVGYVRRISEDTFAGIEELIAKARENLS